jgi:glycosyltransferase involved in cell wall biosynthesis
MSIFSVVIPGYNHARYVKQAVISALRSPLVSEVLLVDDGSTDGTASVLAELAAKNPARVRDLTTKGQGNRGAHARLNELVGAAKCSWVAVLNSDDVFVDGRFEAIVSDERFPQSDFIFGNLLLIDGTGRLVGAKRGPLDPGVPFPQEFDLEKMVYSGNLLDLLAHQNYVATTSNMAFTKALHARLGGFAAFRYVHDWDFALRAVVLGRFAYVRRYITAYRTHTSNTINEGSVGVKAESRSLFDRLLTDFPRLLERPYFVLGLQQNADLVRIQNQAAKIVEATPLRVEARGAGST